MEPITEGFLRFSFDEEWDIIKFDDDMAYRRRDVQELEMKGIDFLGLHERECYLIEVKDYREHRIETQNRLIKGELAIEIGVKVRDTVAAIIGAYRTSSEPEKWQPFARALTNSRVSVKVVVWLEYELPRYPKSRDKVRASVQGNEFKKYLRWLTTKVLICNLNANSVPSLTVSNLPR